MRVLFLKMILNLFDLWELTETQRLEMLGIPEKGKTIFDIIR